MLVLKCATRGHYPTSAAAAAAAAVKAVIIRSASLSVDLLLFVNSKISVHFCIG